MAALAVRDVRREAALVAYVHGVRSVALSDDFLQRLVDFRRHTHGFAEVRGADRENHEFLEGQSVAAVRSAVDDVERGDGKMMGLDRVVSKRSDVVVQRHVRCSSSGTADSHGHSKNTVSSQLGFQESAL